MPEKKLGRPTTNPRCNKLGVRINNRSKETLELYCEAKKTNVTTAIEKAIEKLRDEL